MTIPVHAMAIETFVPVLRTLAELLDKGAAHATARKFEPAVLVSARLAPDMFPLGKHVQIACDSAMDAAARLTGREPTRSESPEETVDALKARIAATVDALEKVTAKALEGADARAIEIPMAGGMAFEMTGLEFLRDWALPQFYFHVVTVYDILRHNGVDLGMRDYASHVGKYIRQRA
jgi:hypothetical protein